MLGHGPGVGDGSTSRLQDNIVLLNRSYRFSEHSGIGWFARVVKAGATDDLGPLLQSGVRDEVSWREITDARSLKASLAGVAGWEEYWRQVRGPVRGLGDVSAILRASQSFRILVALRRGPFGVERVNQTLEQLFRDRRLIPRADIWYPGRPVIIVENDYNLGLYNGDVGVVIPDPESGGRPRVFFEAPGLGIRAISPSRLPRHETVFAMTVHKSQGSEFDCVLFILPSDDSPILSRELIYTGITRARRQLEVWGNAQTLRLAVRRLTTRYSGLADRLAG